MVSPAYLIFYCKESFYLLFPLDYPVIILVETQSADEIFREVKGLVEISFHQACAGSEGIGGDFNGTDIDRLVEYQGHQAVGRVDFRRFQKSVGFDSDEIGLYAWIGDIVLDTPSECEDHQQPRHDAGRPSGIQPTQPAEGPGRFMTSVI